jgi:ubiquinone/menaquinone biosynthesis C-methylase UbiE
MAKANYGIDAPTVLRNLAIAAPVGIIGGFVLLRYVGPIGRPVLSMGMGAGFGASLLLWSSLVGKFRARDALLNAVPWRGDEQVLDVGCGHGLMLIGAAKRLPSGHATGIDIWQDVDQANNSAAATRRNAELEGVRVDVRDGDARHIPFGDATFDVVVSSLALHNIYDRQEREQALHEIARVLKPTGHAAIFDVRHSYAPFFQHHGFTIVKTWTTMVFGRSVVARKNEAVRS